MKTLTMLTLAGALAGAAPALAVDEPSTTSSVPSAQQQCRTELTQMGKATFGLTYGTNANRANAFGRCVSRRAAKTEAAATTARSNAARDCRAERAADAAAFVTKYGTQGRNAFGKCVSTAAKPAQAEIVAAQLSAEVSAARACKAERAADRAAFSAKYGTNANQRNAFGKCVSAGAKA